MTIGPRRARGTALAAYVERACESRVITLPDAADPTGCADVSPDPIHHLAVRAIAERVGDYLAAGIPLHEQAILTRDHHTLRDASLLLRALDVPVATLTDLRHDREVEAILDVCAFARAPDAERIGRILLLRPYAMPDVDVARLRRWFSAGRNGRRPRLTRAGWEAFSRLQEDLRGFTATTSAYEVMTTWLFERSTYLRSVCDTEAADGRNGGLEAVHHLIGVAEEHLAQRDDDHDRLIDRVRRAGAVRQQTAFARAAITTKPDAVMAMTIHAARGREFRAVHVLGWENRAARARYRSGPALASVESERDAEVALFRVAVSRASERLHLAAARRFESFPGAA